MKALSLRQPHAWMLFHGKPLDNRSWDTDFRGWFLVHASKSWNAKDCALAREVTRHVADPPVWPEELPTGGIVGAAASVTSTSTRPCRGRQE